MLNKYKHFKDLKKQAKNMQSELATIVCEGSAMFGKIKVVVNGNRELVGLTIDKAVTEDVEKLQRGVIDAFKDATGTKFQMKLAKKMQEMGGMDAIKNMGL